MAAEATLKFFRQRLKSLLLKEPQIFSYLENQTQILLPILNLIETSIDSIDTNTDAYFNIETLWFPKLTAILHKLEDQIDEFIIQFENQNHQLSDFCKTSLQNDIETLTKIMNGLSENTKGKALADEEGNIIPNFYHMNVPFYLRSCLMYCCIFPENYGIPKGKLIRLMVAEGLVQEKIGEFVEDVAEENIKRLIDLKLLFVVDEMKLEVSSQVRNFVVGMMEQDEFLVSCSSPNTIIPPNTRRISIHEDADNIPIISNSLPVQSLFMFGIGSLSQSEFDCMKPVFNGKKFLRVLDLEGVSIEKIPVEIGDLVHLRYLGLKHSNVDELPESISKLRNLQTLDVRWTNLLSLSSGILNLGELRHLLLFKPSSPNGVLVPVGVGSLKKLQSFTGLYAVDGIAAEIGNLTQLQKLGIKELTEDDVNAVCASVMKMERLRSLTLEANYTHPEAVLPSIEPFSPPATLEKLCLEGRLEKLPSWISSMENLIKLRLGFSRLFEDPALVLQFLPNLKHLTLWRAYDGKTIGKEFCGVGGFPKLEILVIDSDFLEEWTELEQGALPCLKQLCMHNCSKLRMLPDGLQNVTTLEELKLIPLLDDHGERLRPDGGAENYKISHIPLITFILTSTLNSMIVEDDPVEQIIL